MKTAIIIALIFAFIYWLGRKGTFGGLGVGLGGR